MRAMLSLVLSVLGCTSVSAGPPAPARPPPAKVAPKWSPEKPPVGAIGPRCHVRTLLDVTITGEQLHFTFALVNITGKAMKVTLTGTCPHGVVNLGGLPSGYDPMHTCQRGACVTPNESLTIDLPADRTPVPIGETTLASKGDACNPPLPVGSTFYQAEATSTNWGELCSGPQIHIVKAKNGTLRRAKLDEPIVPARPSAPPRTPPKVVHAPAPKPAPKSPARSCPACAFACTRGFPSSRHDAQGCLVCACDDIGP